MSQPSHSRLCVYRLGEPGCLTHGCVSTDLASPAVSHTAVCSSGLTSHCGCFTPGTESQYPLNRRLIGLVFGEESLLLPGFEPQIIEPVALSQY